MLTMRVIASDETTIRINGVIHWQRVFLSDKAVPHKSPHAGTQRR
ncbi:hypothetical protein SPHINGO361_140307 [Sphingomonas sp. EC-HK361]|nr:hypothetical protein SPHINGO361_140307 [Sphingomonas sp. EC-HK361]